VTTSGAVGPTDVNFIVNTNDKTYAGADNTVHAITVTVKFTDYTTVAAITENFSITLHHPCKAITITQQATWTASDIQLLCTQATYTVFS